MSNKVKIFKSKWYVTVRQWPTEHIRQVLPQYGAFDSLTKAYAFLEQPVANKSDPRWLTGGIPMERKPGFERHVPVKGERILSQP